MTLAATGFNSPSALRTDAAGDLYVVDEGNTKVVRIPNIAGTLATSSSAEVSFGIANPTVWQSILPAICISAISTTRALRFMWSIEPVQLFRLGTSIL